MVHALTFQELQRKAENIQRAAVLWKWFVDASSETRMTGLLWADWTATVSQITAHYNQHMQKNIWKHVEHSECSSWQLRTGNRGNIHPGSPESSKSLTKSSGAEECPCLLWRSDGPNVRQTTWKRGSTQPRINGPGCCRCDGAGDSFLAHFRLFSTNRAFYQVWTTPPTLLLELPVSILWWRAETPGWNSNCSLERDSVFTWRPQSPDLTGRCGWSASAQYIILHVNCFKSSWSRRGWAAQRQSFGSLLWSH